MGILFLWVIMIALFISLIILIMAMFNAYEDTQVARFQAKPIEKPVESLLLNRFELHMKLLEMDKEQKKLRKRW